MTDWLPLAAQIATGIGLAACAGLRAFLPPLILGLAGRMDWIHLSSSFDWLASTPALIVFAVAVSVEILSDKIPVVDHLLDILGGIVKPVAGTMVAASVMTDLSPMGSFILGIFVGGGSAGVVHLTKAKVRLFSSFSTGGLGNPILSLGEDVLSLVGSIVAIVIPALLIFALVVTASGIVYARQRFRRRADRLRAGQSVP